MKCHYCGKEIEEDSSFCGYCGKKQLKVRYCIKCGHELDADDVFCGYCGAKQTIEETLQVVAKKTTVEEIGQVPNDSFHVHNDRTDNPEVISFQQQIQDKDAGQKETFEDKTDSRHIEVIAVNESVTPPNNSKNKALKISLIAIAGCCLLGLVFWIGYCFNNNEKYATIPEQIIKHEQNANDEVFEGKTVEYSPIVVYANDPDGWVNVRDKANTRTSNILGRLYNDGEPAEYIGEEGNFNKILFEGKTAFVYKKNSRIDGGSDANNASEIENKTKFFKNYFHRYEVNDGGRLDDYLKFYTEDMKLNRMDIGTISIFSMVEEGTGIDENSLTIKYESGNNYRISYMGDAIGENGKVPSASYLVEIVGIKGNYLINNISR